MNWIESQDTSRVLYGLLLEEDPAVVEKGLVFVLETVHGARTIARHLPDVLLYWYLKQQTPSQRVQQRLLGVLVAHEQWLPDHPLYDEFIPPLLVQLLNCRPDAIECANPAAGSKNVTSVDYEAVSRAILFGRMGPERLLKYVEVAREACMFFLKGEFVSALHALVCLKAIHGNVEHNAYRETIAGFLRDTDAFVSHQLGLVSGSRLAWEIALYQSFSSTVEDSC